MVRECRPPAREPARSWLARRSTMATSTRANASSPASISPVGPPPAITTACVVMADGCAAWPGLAASPRVGHTLEVERDGRRAPLLALCVPPAKVHDNVDSAEGPPGGRVLPDHDPAGRGRGGGIADRLVKSGDAS